MRKILVVLVVFACVQVSFGQLSGSLSGTLGPGTYHIVGDIWVDADSSLQLLPGVAFLFDGHYKFTVSGLLQAIGTEEDSIRFTCDTVTNLAGWGGVRFNSAHDSCCLKYCVIEHGRAMEWPDEKGGGVYCDYSSPTFAHCTFSDDSADDGGGVYCSNGSPVFEHCTFSGNSASWGGAVCCGSNSSPNLSHCTINNNSAEYLGGGVECDNASSPVLMNCTISGNSAMEGNGGGVNCYGEVTLLNCTVSRNWASSVGGGIACSLATATLTNCVVSANEAVGSQWWPGYGGGIYCGWGSLVISYSTISGNASGMGAGVYCSLSEYFPDMFASINNTLIVFSQGPGICLNSAAQSQVGYCAIYGNSGGDIVFPGDDPSHGPPGIGQLVTANANGDSSDMYFNIFCNPMFADTANDDYHLTAMSCCIDAGSSPCELEEDNTLPDMGAFHFPSSPPNYGPSLQICLCYSVEETGRYVSWRPFGNATGYRVYRSVQVDLPLNQWQLLTTTPPNIWDYLDSEAYDPAMRYFYQVVVLY